MNYILMIYVKKLRSLKNDDPKKYWACINDDKCGIEQFSMPHDIVEHLKH
jgi:hypothetical protein